MIGRNSNKKIVQKYLADIRKNRRHSEISPNFSLQVKEKSFDLALLSAWHVNNNDFVLPGAVFAAIVTH